MPHGVEPCRRFVILDFGLEFDRLVPLFDGLFFFAARPGKLRIESARRRKESRGLHYMVDYPQKAEIARDTELQLTNGPAA